MSSIHLKRALLGALLTIVLPGMVSGQEAQPAAPTDPAVSAAEMEMEAWYNELQSLHQQLQAVQDQALADTLLAARQEELGAVIRLAMAEVDSTMEGKMTRMKALEAEASTAQQDGNMQRIQELMLEASDIQDHFMQLQQQVVENPGIAAQLTVFQEELQQRMMQLDPQAQQLMDRFRELEGKLTAAMSGDGL